MEKVLLTLKPTAVVHNKEAQTKLETIKRQQGNKVFLEEILVLSNYRWLIFYVSRSICNY